MESAASQREGGGAESEARLELLLVQMGHMSAMITEQAAAQADSLSQGIASVQDLVRAESEGRSHLCEVVAEP